MPGDIPPPQLPPSSGPMDAQATRPMPTPYDGRQPSPEDYGAGISGGLNDLQGVVARARDDVNASVVAGADADFTSTTNHKLAEFSQLKGQDAIARSTALTQELQKYRNDRAQEISDPRARQVFLNRSAGSLAQASGHVESYVASQIQAVKDQNYKADEGAHLDTIATHFDDDATYLREKAYLRGLAMVQAARLGADGPTRDRLLTLADRSAAESRLQAMIGANQGAKALAFLTPDVKESLGTDAAKWEHDVRQVGIAQTADITARGIFARSPRDPMTGAIDENFAWNQLRQALPPGHPAYDTATDRMNMLLREDEAARKQSQRVTFENAFSIGTDPTTKAFFLDRVQTAKGGPALLARLQRVDPEGLSALKRLSDSYDLKGERAESDEEKLNWAQLEISAAVEPEKFLGWTSADYARNVGAKINPRKFDAGARLVSEAMKNALKDGGSRDFSVNTPKQMLLDEMQQAGLAPGPDAGYGVRLSDPGTWPKSQYALYSNASGRLEEFIEQQGGIKNAKPEDVRKFVHSLVARGSVYGSSKILSDDTTTNLEYRIDPARFGGKPFEPEQVDGVPDEDLVQIRAALHKKKLPATESNVLDLFHQRHGK